MVALENLVDRNRDSLVRISQECTRVLDRRQYEAEMTCPKVVFSPIKHLRLLDLKDSTSGKKVIHSQLSILQLDQLRNNCPGDLCRLFRKRQNWAEDNPYRELHSIDVWMRGDV